MGYKYELIINQQKIHEGSYIMHAVEITSKLTTCLSFDGKAVFP